MINLDYMLFLHLFTSALVLPKCERGPKALAADRWLTHGENMLHNDDET
jgi:hypothetical protein